MQRSLFTGVSGLSVHQTMLDVTANNAANVNTAGFKSASTRFEDTFSQLVRSTGEPKKGEKGGINPAQIGLGVKLQSITNNFTGGAAQNTDRNLDTMINGEGFFALKKTDGTMVYTRNGSFGLDAKGQLVAADGSFVQGWQANDKGQLDATGAIGNLVLPLTATFEASPTKKITYGGNLPADKILANSSKASKEPFTKTQILTVYDDKGMSHNIVLQFDRSNDYKNPGAAPVWKVSAYDEAAYKALSNNKTEREKSVTEGGARISLNLEEGNSGDTSAVEITFSADGRLTPETQKKLQSVKFQIQQVNIGADGKVTVTKDPVAKEKTVLDLSGITSFAGVDSAQYESIDGSPAGTLTGFGVEADGTIRGTFTSGSTHALGKIATAAFANPLGLKKVGTSYFVESENSGKAQVGEPGSGKRGSMTGGAIEMSNVDLGTEFTNLILSQRGFQANTRVVTTSDEVLQEVVTMKR